MRWLAAWSRWFWFEPTPAFNLAVCRIVVCGSLFVLGLFDHPERWAGVDRSYWMPIELFRLLGWEPASANTLVRLHQGLQLALLMACLGLGTRWATAAAFGLGLYQFGLPQNFAKVDHSETIVVLVLAILAGSRCGAALSLDAWLRARSTGTAGQPPARSSEFTWPIRLVWVLMVIAFCAAGVGKLRGSGLAWITSDSMQNLLVRHQYSHDPPLDLGPRIAAWPLLCHALAAATIVLETLCPLALVSRRLRVPWMLGLLGMQVGILLLMGIDFRRYFPCYAFWIPWDRLAGVTSAPPGARPVADRVTTERDGW